MNKNSVINAVRLMGLKIQSKHRKGVLTRCPFAWRSHAGGFDKGPSFSIEINPRDVSRYYCFSCRESGTITYLAEAMRRMGEIDESVVAKIRKMEEEPSDDLMLLPDPDEEQEPPWRKMAKEVNWSEVPQYALGRGLNLDTITKWGLGYDKERMRLAFPVWDVFENAVGLAGRALGDSSIKYLSYPGFQKSRYLYGEHLIPRHESPRHIVLNEGFLDVLMAFQNRVPYCVLGTMGVDLSERQMMTLETWADRVTVFFDGDKAGRESAVTMANRLVEYCSPEIGIYVVTGDYPDGKTDPKELTPEGYCSLVEEAEEVSPNLGIQDAESPDAPGVQR